MVKGQVDAFGARFLAYLKGLQGLAQTMPSRLARRIGGAIGSGQGETRRGGLSMLGDMGRLAPCHGLDPEQGEAQQPGHPGRDARDPQGGADPEPLQGLGVQKGRARWRAPAARAAAGADRPRLGESRAPHKSR